MQYWLRLKRSDGVHSGVIFLNYGDNQASRGATIAGLGKVRDQVEIRAWDIDEQGRRWDKEV